MGIRVDHLTADELVSIRSGETASSDAISHLYECISCRRELAWSVLLISLSGAGDAREPEADFPQSRHPSEVALARYHEAAFEARDVDPAEFLRIDSHLRRCNQCRVAFATVHRRLSPSATVVDRVAARIRQASAPTVGRLTIVTEIVRRFSIAFEPHPLDERPDADLAAEGLVAYSRREEPPVASAQFMVGDSHVRLEIEARGDRLFARVRHGKGGVGIQLVDEDGRVLDETRADNNGFAILPLRREATRLRFLTQDQNQVSDIRLTFAARP